MIDCSTQNVFRSARGFMVSASVWQALRYDRLTELEEKMRSSNTVSVKLRKLGFFLMGVG